MQKIKICNTILEHISDCILWYLSPYTSKPKGTFTNDITHRGGKDWGLFSL